MTWKSNGSPKKESIVLHSRGHSRVMQYEWLALSHNTCYALWNLKMEKAPHKVSWKCHLRDSHCKYKKEEVTRLFFIRVNNSFINGRYALPTRTESSRSMILKATTTAATNPVCNPLCAWSAWGSLGSRTYFWHENLSYHIHEFAESNVICAKSLTVQI